MFFGRKYELRKLAELRERETAALAVVYGRRRIGKSTLITEFAKGSNFIELYGLSPHMFIFECRTVASLWVYVGAAV